MITPTYLPEEMLIRRALEALTTALGPVEAARFLSLQRDRAGDYVVWHQEWQAKLDPQRFFADVFESDPKTAAENP